MHHTVLTPWGEQRFSGGAKGRTRAIEHASWCTRQKLGMLLIEGDLIEGDRIAAIEWSKLGPFTLVSWTAMRDESSSLVWVIERASGMVAGECDRLGIDWKAGRDRRIALGGSW